MCLSLWSVQAVFLPLTWRLTSSPRSAVNSKWLDGSMDGGGDSIYGPHLKRPFHYSNVYLNNVNNALRPSLTFYTLNSCCLSREFPFVTNDPTPPSSHNLRSPATQPWISGKGCAVTSVFAWAHQSATAGSGHCAESARKLALWVGRCVSQGFA